MNNETKPVPAISEKSYGVAVALSGIFGLLGVQHLYLRRWGEAALDIGLWVTSMYFFLSDQPLLGVAVFLLDLLHSVVVTSMLLTGNYKDGSGKIVAYPGQFPKPIPEGPSTPPNPSLESGGHDEY